LIFDGVLAWSEDFAPLRPACTRMEFERLGTRLTRVLRLDFGLKSQSRADGEWDYTPASKNDGEWSVKYNGWIPPVDELPPGALVAAFLSPHKEDTHFAYLKIGSILWAPFPDAQ